MMDWLAENPALIAAWATALLVLFAGFQVGLEIARRRDSRRIAKAEAIGPAWRARRTCEEALRATDRYPEADRWAEAFTAFVVLDALQRQMLEVLRLSAIVGGKEARAGQAAFRAFLGFATAAKQVRMVPHSAQNSVGEPIRTEENLKEIRKHSESAVDHLLETVGYLAEIAPRRPEEPAIPSKQEIRLLQKPQEETGE